MASRKDITNQLEAWGPPWSDIRLTVDNFDWLVDGLDSSQFYAGTDFVCGRKNTEILTDFEAEKRGQVWITGTSTPVLEFGAKDGVLTLIFVQRNFLVYHDDDSVPAG